MPPHQKKGHPLSEITLIFQTISEFLTCRSTA
nr:MAG TPA: hypothetical protein [Caudoviricetes sp.]